MQAEITRFERDLDSIESTLKPTELVVTDDTGVVGSSLQFSRRKIGEILVANKALEPKQVERILKEQEKNDRLLFGELALKLKLIKKQDLTRALGQQFGYPCRVTDSDSYNRELIAINDPFGQQTEAMRSLRSQLLLQWDGVPKPVAVISPEGGEGRSFLAANLAIVFAQLGKRTLLIDADLRRPKQHYLFNLPKDPGLSVAFSSRASECQPHQISIVPSLYVMTAGPPPPNPQELLSQSAFSMLLQQADEHFDYVVVDTPPASVYSDAEITAAQAGAALMVACKDQTSFGLLRDLSNRVKKRSTIVGCVMNETP